jgi:hypothetical protein
VPKALLGQLLTGPQSGEYDLQIPVRAGGQPPRDVGDPHWLAHVEHEDLSSSADHGRLQH